jgi:hypothetical protein
MLIRQIRKQVNKELVNLIGEKQDTEPKSRRYTACCTSEEMGILIYEMIQNGEHEEVLSRDEIYKIKEYD